MLTAAVETHCFRSLPQRQCLQYGRPESIEWIRVVERIPWTGILILGVVSSKREKTESLARPMVPVIIRISCCFIFGAAVSLLGIGSHRYTTTDDLPNRSIDTPADLDASFVVTYAS